MIVGLKVNLTLETWSLGLQKKVDREETVAQVKIFSFKYKQSKIEGRLSLYLLCLQTSFLGFRDNWKKQKFTR